MAEHPLKLCYGPAPSQFLLLHKPSTPAPHPLVIILHGGFWKSKYGLIPPSAAIDTLAPDLLSHNYAVAEIEYRRSDDPGWGFPGTNEDVAAAYRLVTQRSDINKQCIFVVGHSAGGTLALWLAAQQQTSGGILPTRTFALAPVADLREAARLRLSDDGDAVQRYLGGQPDEVPEKYENACPMDMFDTLKHVNITLVAGLRDDDVPPSLVVRLFEKTESSLDGGGIWEYKVFDCDHYELVSAGTQPWRWVVERMRSQA